MPRRAAVDAGDGDPVLEPRERWTFRCRRAIAGAFDLATIPIAVTADGDGGAGGDRRRRGDGPSGTRGSSAFTGAPPLGLAPVVFAILVTAGVDSRAFTRRRRRHG